jgi:hypothetical protein
MKTKTLILFALILALVLAGIAPRMAAAGNAGVTFRAKYDMSPRIVGVDENGCNIQKFPGVGRATNLEKTTFYSDARSCPQKLVQSGDMHIIAPDGDQLIGNFSGRFAFPRPGYVKFTGSYTITGGTGRFENMTGTGKYWGTAQLAPGGSATFYLDGKLYK